MANDFFLENDLKKAISIKNTFPIFKKHPSLRYLDNAATTHKPELVIKSLSDFYAFEYATVHRGVYSLSQDATSNVEKVRLQVANFIGASQAQSIVFVRGTTEAINLVADSFPKSFVQPGKDIVITAMEHHANLVPWQQMCENYDLNLKIIPIAQDGALELDHLDRYITSNTALLAFCHASNILGTVNPLKKLIKRARDVGAKILVDGAQGPSHFKVDVTDLDCDFYCFSGHKLFGPTGIGILYIKPDLLSQLAPYQLGGAMINQVTFKKTTYASSPARFEAGTPAIAEIIGLGAAISFVESLGYDFIERYENALYAYFLSKIKDISDIQLYGTTMNKIAICSFNFLDIHPHDAGTIFDSKNIALRVGHHCSQPLMDHYDVAAMSRVSFSIYNLPEDIDCFVDSLAYVKEVMT